MQCQISRFEMSKQMVSVCMCRKSRHKPIVIIDDGTIQKICVSLEYFYSKDYINTEFKQFICSVLASGAILSVGSR